MECHLTLDKLDQSQGWKKGGNALLTLSTVAMTSASVVKRPIPKRMDECARSSLAPIARSTYDGSRDADVQADPEDNATSFSAISKLSPSMNANDRFTQPGKPSLGSPLRMTCETYR